MVSACEQSSSGSSGEPGSDFTVAPVSKAALSSSFQPLGAVAAVGSSVLSLVPSATEPPVPAAGAVVAVVGSAAGVPMADELGGGVVSDAPLSSSLLLQAVRTTAQASSAAALAEIFRMDIKFPVG